MSDLQPLVRPCDGCANVDDHPRHIIGTMSQSVRSQCWHFDCHAEQGCQLCAGQLEASGNLHGSNLTEWLAQQRAMVVNGNG